MTNFITPVFISLSTLAVWYVGKYFFEKALRRYHDIGFNSAIVHVFNQVKNKGNIEIKLDGESMTLVAGKSKKKNQEDQHATTP